MQRILMTAMLIVLFGCGEIQYVKQAGYWTTAD